MANKHLNGIYKAPLPDLLFLDLEAEVTPVIQAAIARLPHYQPQFIIQACERDSAMELHVRPGAPARMELWLVRRWDGRKVCQVPVDATEDLALAVMNTLQSALNSLTSSDRAIVAEAIDAGAHEIELRYRDRAPPEVSVWLVPMSGPGHRLAWWPKDRDVALQFAINRADSGPSS